MSRITISLSETIATELLKAKREQLKKQESALQKLAEAIYLSTVPAVVLDCFKKHKNYLDVTSSKSFIAPGLQANERFYFTKQVPDNGDRVAIDQDQADALRKAKDDYEKAEDTYRQTRREVIGTLQSISTFKRLRDEWPEAAAFLPNDGGITRAVAINVAALKAKL